MTGARESGERLGVIVLGMHRSGTSLVSHLLGELGLSHGGELMEPKFDNPLGYFEHAGVVEIHDDFLAELGRDWQDPRSLKEEHFSSAAAGRARRRIRELFEADFAPHEGWVLKDPRHCRLLPLWDEILESRRQEVRFVHVLRSPAAVARSLAVRDGISEARSHLLWLLHVLESERRSRGFRRVTIEFELLTEDPAGVFTSACEQLGLGERLKNAGSDLCERVLDRSQVHHHRDMTAVTPPWVARAWKALTGSAADLERQLEPLAAEMGDARFLYEEGVVDPLAEDLAAAEDERDALRSELEQTTSYAREVEETLEEKERYTASLEQTLAERDQIIAAKDRQSAEAAAYTRKLERMLEPFIDG